MCVLCGGFTFIDTGIPPPRCPPAGLGVELEYFNGGGSGSLVATASDPAVTEVAVGSGFLQARFVRPLWMLPTCVAPALTASRYPMHRNHRPGCLTFTDPTAVCRPLPLACGSRGCPRPAWSPSSPADLSPAATRVSAVVRFRDWIACNDAVTLHSTQPPTHPPTLRSLLTKGADKQPIPILPPGLVATGGEGFGEVQTPLMCASPSAYGVPVLSCAGRVQRLVWNLLHPPPPLLFNLLLLFPFSGARSDAVQARPGSGRCGGGAPGQVGRDSGAVCVVLFVPGPRRGRGRERRLRRGPRERAHLPRVRVDLLLRR